MPPEAVLEARPGMATTRIVAAAVGVLVLLVGVGCSGSVDVSVGGSKGISGPSLEEDLSDRVTELTDLAPASVDCPDGLDAKVGATTTCEMVHDGVRATLDVEAKELSEDEETLDFSWQVDPGSQRLLTDGVGDLIADAFAERTQLTLTGLVCPEAELVGTAGTEMTCEATTAEGRSGPVDLTVTGSQGMRVNFSWRLGES